MKQEQKLLTISDLAAYLNVKAKTLYAKVEAGEIPYYHIGRLVRFRLTEIDAWLGDCSSKKRQATEQQKPRNRSKSSKRSTDLFSKIITKTIDEETDKYYSVANGESDRIEGSMKEVEHGSI